MRRKEREEEIKFTSDNRCGVGSHTTPCLIARDRRVSVFSASSHWGEREEERRCNRESFSVSDRSVSSPSSRESSREEEKPKASGRQMAGAFRESNSEEREEKERREEGERG